MITPAQCIQFLNSRKVARVNFALDIGYGPRMVYPEGYRAVAARIASNGLNSITITTDPNQRDCGACSMSITGSAELIFRSDVRLDTVAGRMTVLHECTHAVFQSDGQNKRFVRGADEELLTHFAEAMYLAISGETAPASLNQVYLIDEARRLATGGYNVNWTPDVRRLYAYVRHYYPGDANVRVLGR
jgi:hypothetical protein